MIMVRHRLYRLENISPGQTSNRPRGFSTAFRKESSKVNRIVGFLVYIILRRVLKADAFHFLATVRSQAEAGRR